HSIDGTNRPRPRSVEQLTEELRSVKKILRSTIATLEVTNEELQTVNEELQPTNEELQSTNEEMETSKEELQSMNEESETVNAELQSRNDDLTHINDDLKNLLDSTETATIFLDKEFRVGRFTSGATSIIPLVPADAGRHIGDFACRLVDTTIEVWATQVLDTLVTVERAVRTEAGRRYRLRIRPYRTSNNAVDGVVITFDDTTTQMKLVDSLETSERMVRLVLQHTRDDVHTVDRDGTILYSNRPNSSEQGEAPAKRIFDVWPEEFHEATRATLRRVFESGIPETLDTTAADSDDRAIHSVTQALPIWSAGKVTSAILITVDQDSVGSKSRNPS
ncbi:MAG: two-component system CheB/CheR fusion protein, partial [Polyangiales bacterium]